MNWNHITKLPPERHLVWIHTRKSFVFDLGFWNGQRWLPWTMFDSADWRDYHDIGVVAWAPIDWSEIDQSLPEEMRIID